MRAARHGTALPQPGASPELSGDATSETRFSSSFRGSSLTSYFAPFVCTPKSERRRSPRDSPPPRSPCGLRRAGPRPAGRGERRSQLLSRPRRSARGAARPRPPPPRRPGPPSARSAPRPGRSHRDPPGAAPPAPRSRSGGAPSAQGERAAAAGVRQRPAAPPPSSTRGRSRVGGRRRAGPPRGAGEAAPREERRCPSRQRPRGGTPGGPGCRGKERKERGSAAEPRRRRIDGETRRSLTGRSSAPLRSTRRRRLPAEPAPRARRSRGGLTQGPGRGRPRAPARGGASAPPRLQLGRRRTPPRARPHRRLAPPPRRALPGSFSPAQAWRRLASGCSHWPSPCARSGAVGAPLAAPRVCTHAIRQSEGPLRGGGRGGKAGPRQPPPRVASRRQLRLAPHARGGGEARSEGSARHTCRQLLQRRNGRHRWQTRAVACTERLGSADPPQGRGPRGSAAGKRLGARAALRSHLDLER